MADRELKLNSVSRYSKESPQFILEEHGHCEVPAGCGGVVLRWRNPHRTIPIEIWLYTAGTSEFYLDGTYPPSGRPLIGYGEHVFAFRLSGFDTRQALLMLAAIYNEAEMIHVELSHPTGNLVRILSAPDGSWKYSLIEPQDDTWMQSGFNDSAWKLMILKPLPKITDKDREWYRFKRLQEFEAKGLGIEGPGKTVWVRRVFSLKEPES